MPCDTLTELIRGDTIPFKLTLSIDGNPISIVGDKIYFTLKTNKTDLDASAVLQYSYTYPSNADTLAGIGDFHVPASSMAEVAPGTYYYDLQWKRNVSPVEVYTISLGQVKVSADMTITTA